MTHATREVRFAVVLYGGTSLAIYMNGISQELLRMVRGGSDVPDSDLDEVEKIYREISGNLTPNSTTRFVVDIISGTSAGGINGVALAKALVVGSRNLDVLRAAWTDDADIDKLLADGGLGNRWSRSESLLDGGLMYRLLHRTLAAMGDATKGRPLVDTIDLFVTATDLEGRNAPVQLAGKSIDEKVHRTVFRFSYQADPDNPGAARPNDFANDAMLAFAARCTSSFPVAFPPVRAGDLPKARRQEAGLDDGAHADRTYADGGYLDTKPFGYAIDLIPFRPARLPGERKLLFIDPFPDDPAKAATADDAPRGVDFVTNARLAATTLPRREVIREDIRQIAAMNRRLERLSALQDRWESDRETLSALGALREAPKSTDFDKVDLEELVVNRGYGQQYPLYHHLRVYGATDTLSDLVANLAGVAPDSATALYLRQILRAWRNETYVAYLRNGGGRESETAFLSRYDIDFRRRRLAHLRAELAKELGQNAVPDHWALWREIEAELVRLRRLSQPDATDAAALLGGIDAAELARLLDPGFAGFMAEPDFDRRYEIARQEYRRASLRIDDAMAKIGASLRARFDDSSATIRGLLARAPLQGLRHAYDDFHWHDVSAFPFLEGTSAQEHAEVEVYRVSPADSALDRDPGKLAGISFGAFGGFLSRDWREHDILWGRLDGAEAIVNALMSPGDARRKGYVDRLQCAILAQEFAGATGKGRREAMLRRLVGKGSHKAIERLLKPDLPVTDRASFQALYAKPLDPEPTQLAGWGSRAGRIMAQMLDDLPSDGALGAFGGRFAGPIRTGSVFAARLALFATPGGYLRLLGEWWLFLILLAGLLLVGLSVAMPASIPIWPGVAIAAGAAILWLLLYVAGRVLSRRTTLPRAALVLAAVVVSALATVGAWTLVKGAPPDFALLWRSGSP